MNTSNRKINDESKPNPFENSNLKLVIPWNCSRKTLIRKYPVLFVRGSLSNDFSSKRIAYLQNSQLSEIRLQSRQSQP